MKTYIWLTCRGYDVLTEQAAMKKLKRFPPRFQYQSDRDQRDFVYDCGDSKDSTRKLIVRSL